MENEQQQQQQHEEAEKQKALRKLMLATMAFTESMEDENNNG